MRERPQWSWRATSRKKVWCTQPPPKKRWVYALVQILCVHLVVIACWCVIVQGRGSAKDGGEFLKINRPYKCLVCDLRFCVSLQVRGWLCASGDDFGVCVLVFACWCLRMIVAVRLCFWQQQKLEESYLMRSDHDQHTVRLLSTWGPHMDRMCNRGAFDLPRSDANHEWSQRIISNLRCKHDVMCCHDRAFGCRSKIV